MFNKHVFLVVLCSLFNCTPIEATPKNTQVDLIIQGLENQTWLQDETKCIQDTLHILHNVKNHTLWAVWIWNSMQHPTGMFYGSRYSLGNYDQCLKAPSVTREPNLLTQYCLIDIKLTDQIGRKDDKLNAYGTTDEFLEVKSSVGRSFNVISWGTCLPATCNTRAVIKIVKSIYLLNPLASTDPNVTVDNCQLAGEKTIYSTQFYVFMIVIASLIVTAIASTIYLQDNTQDTRLTRLAYCFSLQRNWASFTRVTADEIPFLSFTKSFHAVMTTCAHGFVFQIMGAVGNGLDFDYYLIKKEYMLGNLIQHLDLPSIENFFIISGLLVMKSLMEKKKSSLIYLIQRYIRFIGSFSFLIFYTIAVSKYTGDGPLWNKFSEREHKACEENWLLSLLMLNNYVNSENVCQIVAWFVPCDYHLTIMGTILFCVWQWNKEAGKVTTILTGFLALVLPGIVTYRKRLAPILMNDIDQMIETRTNTVYLESYIPSHHRAGPYLIGMALGYILTMYKPAKYRGVISRGWSYIGFIVAGALGLKIWTSAAAWCSGEYNAWNAAIYAAFNRNIWALSTCMCIAIAEYGDIPKLQSIFAWPGFAIFSRLAYGVYITHSLILQRNIYSQRSPMQFDLFSVTINGLGVLVASSVCAILLWLFVEAPLVNLTNLIVAPRKQAAINGIHYVQPMDKNKMNNEMKNGKQL